MGDEFPTSVTSVTENNPGQHVDLAKELGKGKVIVFGVPGAVSAHSTQATAQPERAEERLRPHLRRSMAVCCSLLTVRCVPLLCQFTPGCSNTHLPSFLKDYERIKGKGVDQIVCLSVNDAFVMHGTRNHTQHCAALYSVQRQI